MPLFHERPDHGNARFQATMYARWRTSRYRVDRTTYDGSDAIVEA
ncbi:MAG TPA: hypothetical protein VEX15_10945 [Nocardioidaceae bacterium]|nr:hypothetical protein [Nocardioidaceae bacterium]